MMKPHSPIERREFLILGAASLGGMLTARADSVFDPRFVSLKDAHIGTEEIDIRIMNQYGDQPQEVQDFYLACREAFTGKDPEKQVAEVCRKFGQVKLGGPMLGHLSPTGFAVWLHLPEPEKVEVRVKPDGGGSPVVFKSAGAGRVLSVSCDGLTSNTAYAYEVIDSKGRKLGEGTLVTPPSELSEEPFRIAFGTCFHKVGMYRPELMKSIRERGNRAMLILGDSAVDGRQAKYGLIQSDYLLRNLSPHWQALAANVPISATWDDHDYFGDDTSGTTTRSGKPIDVVGLRKAWKKNWNNPERNADRKGIYFSSRIGPVHHIALDTRSCRINEDRGKLNSFLGEDQMAWLKQQIESSDAPFILISGGTMWSDYISAGKDSWGTWDTEGREQIFQWIDAKKDTLVLLLSGDRHGARGFAIPRPNGSKIHELEIAGMGGVPGPGAFEKGREHQLFGYPGPTWAFGELSFSVSEGRPQALFRMIDPEGVEKERVSFPE